MFDEPEDQDEKSQEKSLKPADRAREKSDEFRIHAELAAVFEGNRKFDAEMHTRLDPNIARECQKGVGRLEKAKPADSPVLPEGSIAEAAGLLDIPHTQGIPTNDYHIHRRPGEVMILRWLEGEQVESFYTRLQAHFDAAFNAYVEDEKQTHGWKQDSEMEAYLKALEEVKITMADRYLRSYIKQHNLFVLSTQSADEMDIFHLCDFIMGIPAAEIVGEVSAPQEDPTEQDRAWFFKLFALRGMKETTEQMFFFTYLQKSDAY